MVTIADVALTVADVLRQIGHDERCHKLAVSPRPLPSGAKPSTIPSDPGTSGWTRGMSPRSANREHRSQCK